MEMGMELMLEAAALFWTVLERGIIMFLQMRFDLFSRTAKYC